jgi:hypothetical protein
MIMQLLLEIGYEKLLLPESANVAAVLDALSLATPVESKHGDYLEPVRYVPKAKLQCPLSPTYVLNNQVISEEVGVELDIKALEKRNADLYTENGTLAKELKELKEKVATLTGE